MIQLNWKKYLEFAPYILILAANFIYLYIHGFGPLKNHPKLIIYNVVFFIIIGVFVTIKVNLMLHSWYVKQQGDVKQKTKKAIKNILQKIDFVISIFRFGNQRMMIRIFLLVQLWIFLKNHIPSFLLGVFVGTYFQYKGFIYQRFQKQFKQLSDSSQQLLQVFLKKVPKYQRKNYLKHQ